MRIPAPSFDYNSLATPGGVGHGLASIAGAVVNARATQNKANVDAQGLARLERRDQEDRALRAAEMEERTRANAANEDIRKQELGLRGLESFGRGAVNVGKGLGSLISGPKEAAQIDHLKSMAEKNRRPPVPKAPPQLGHEARVGYMKLLEQAKADLRSQAVTNPKAFAPRDVEWDILSPDLPAERNLEAELAELDKTHPAAIALRDATVNQQAPVAAGNLRARVSARFGGKLPPEWEQSLMEAEAGDAESMQQLEEMMGVAPQDSDDLLGGQQ